MPFDQAVADAYARRYRAAADAYAAPRLPWYARLWRWITA